MDSAFLCLWSMFMLYVYGLCLCSMFMVYVLCFVQYRHMFNLLKQRSSVIVALASA